MSSSCPPLFIPLINLQLPDSDTRTAKLKRKSQTDRDGHCCSRVFIGPLFVHNKLPVNTCSTSSWNFCVCFRFGRSHRSVDGHDFPISLFEGKIIQPQLLSPFTTSLLANHRFFDLTLVGFSIWNLISKRGFSFLLALRKVSTFL